MQFFAGACLDKDIGVRTLPEGLYNELERFVKESNGYHVSISEVVREAL
jgi:Arc/MetJ-type ribon-helix-helix transcriptional regulator